jgi:hypothetical protein
VDISRSNCTKCTQISFIFIPKNPRKAKEILGKIHKSFGPQTLLESFIQILNLNSLSEYKLSLIWISTLFGLNPRAKSSNSYFWRSLNFGLDFEILLESFEFIQIQQPKIRICHSYSISHFSPKHSRPTSPHGHHDPGHSSQPNRSPQC